jgi:hypothetical protein
VKCNYRELSSDEQVVKSTLDDGDRSLLCYDLPLVTILHSPVSSWSLRYGTDSNSLLVYGAFRKIVVRLSVTYL